MNRMPLSIILALVVCAMLRQASAFTSMQVFGDGVSTVTNNVSPGTNYYFNRFCNGRVWVEVLAERQGLTLATNQNLSFFEDYSSNLLVNVSNYIAQPDVATTLFVVWVNDADFIKIIENLHPNRFYPTNIVIWTNNLNLSLSNHALAIQTLYNKGARTLIMPNGVDVAKVPNYQFMSPTNKFFVRQRIIEFNRSFTNVLHLARSSLPNLTIITPDFFSLVDNLIGVPGSYGFTNSTSDALDDLGYTPLNGPGTNYVFWDYLNPTAKVQEILADMTQALISPTRITGIKSLGGSNELTVTNVPVGLDGFVDGTTNLVTWSSGQSFDSTNVTQTINVPINGPRWFYRLRFPFAWSWP